MGLRLARPLPIAISLALLTGFGFSSHQSIAHVPTAEADAPQPLVVAAPPASPLSGIHKIQHVVIVMQENHSFDNYFGTYPGADGIPMQNGTPTVCVTDPSSGACLRPFHDTSDVSFDPPHKAADATEDMNGGLMDGFLTTAAHDIELPCGVLKDCSTATIRQAVGYHTASEVPVYWAYASQFVLQDHLFASTASFTLPSHLALVSGWAASCGPVNPMDCTTNAASPSVPRGTDVAPYTWTDITYLLHRDGVNWAYFAGSTPVCEDGADCKGNRSAFDEYVNPLSGFKTVRDDGQLDNLQPIDRFLGSAKAGTLPAVSWVTPDATLSEHPPYSIKAGEDYVARLVNAVMQGPDWGSTAIFITWDEWGGFYDHVQPPVIDGVQLGMRVPGLVISPYAKQGTIDHQTLTFQSYLRFIEDDFLHGQRLDPKTDGRPDGRTAVLDGSPALGDVSADFDFNQPPRSPMLLRTTP